MSAQKNNILAELDIDNLQNSGLAGPSDVPGFLRLHKRRLHVSSDSEHGDLALERADTIWSAWKNWPATGPQRDLLPDNQDTDGGGSSRNNDSGGLLVPFLDFVVGRVVPTYAVDVDSRHDDDAWAACLDACGVNDALKTAIMDPTFRCIRQTESCRWWLRDTLTMRYAGLEEIQRASLQRATDIRLAIDDTDGTITLGGRENNRRSGAPGKSRSSAQSAATPSHHRQLSLSEVQQAAAPGVSKRHWSRDTANEVANKPNHVILYKGMDQARLDGFWRQNADANNNHDDDDDGDLGNWRVETLLSFPPTNFSGQHALFYFMPDARVAEYYAAYAKRRSSCESVVVVAVTIKTADLHELEEMNDETGAAKTFRLYYPSPHWKQLVWRSKNARAFPKPLRKYRDAVLLIGTATKGAQRSFQSMATWEEITSDNVLRIPESNPNPAIQYVFHAETGGEFLRKSAQFEVFPMSNADAAAVVVPDE
ncbi:hypothetical protein SEUCBS140593_001638 [Sporothrix eucalyptigena]|uniref:Uncharacterized protein n=1 Tax=Sporothrix eucalyptigena TaxID=1812306 RepID=A0ABP0AZX7_9PEZI